eukprot:358157-Chlamydomonas_euryale.AAC.3
MDVRLLSTADGLARGDVSAHKRGGRAGRRAGGGGLWRLATVCAASVPRIRDGAQACVGVRGG